jgi:hypothetical protein
MGLGGAAAATVCRAGSAPSGIAASVAALWRAWRDTEGDAAAAAAAAELVAGAARAGNRGGAVAHRPQLRAAELAGLAHALVVALQSVRSVLLLGTVVCDAGMRVGAEGRRGAVAALVFVVAQGDPLAFVALECLRWLSVDPAFRANVLEGDAVSVTSGAGLSAVMAVRGDSEPTATARERLLLEQVVALLSTLHETEAARAASAMLRARSLKLLMAVNELALSRECVARAARVAVALRSYPKGRVYAARLAPHPVDNSSSRQIGMS